MPPNAIADNAWHWDVRYDLGIPVGKLGVTDVGNGLGFEASLSYSLSRRISLYGGWSFRRFNTGQRLPSGSNTFQDNGFGLGAQWLFRAGSQSVGYRVRAGYKYDFIEFENQLGEVASTSDHYLGWEVAIAFLIPLDDHWDLTPGVRYISLPADLLTQTGGRVARLEYLSIGIGISHRF